MNIAIIGAGPAGISAAIQLKRYGFDPIVFEKEKIGGLIKNAWKIENYLGFPKGISGREMVSLLENQLKKWDINVVFEEVKRLDFKEKFLIETNRSRYSFDIVVVASGTKPKKMDVLERLADDTRRKIFYEVHPLLDEEHKSIAVIGSGDAAFDYTINLSERDNKIYLINSRKRVKALPLLVKMVKENSRITYLERVEIQDVKSIEDRISISFKENRIDVDYLLVAIGREGNKDFYSDGILKNEKRLLSEGKLYLIGDVKNGIYRQASIAIGDGIKAAMKIYHKFGGLK